MGIECRSSDSLSSDFSTVHILLGADRSSCVTFSFVKHFKMILLEVNFVESKLGGENPTVSNLNCLNIKASSRKSVEIDLVAKTNEKM